VETKMEEKEEIEKIKCALFKAKNESIEKIAKFINETKNIKQKSRLAERLMKEAKELLSCQQFNERRLECQICQKISELRRKTADLIIKPR